MESKKHFPMSSMKIHIQYWNADNYIGTFFNTAVTSQKPTEIPKFIYNFSGSNSGLYRPA